MQPEKRARDTHTHPRTASKGTTLRLCAIVSPGQHSRDGGREQLSFPGLGLGLGRWGRSRAAELYGDWMALDPERSGAHVRLHQDPKVPAFHSVAHPADQCHRPWL